MEKDFSLNTGCSSCLKRKFSLLENLSEIELNKINSKRKEIANLANMTTSNAIRSISLFNKKEIIKTERRKIWILNLKALSKISEENISKFE